MEKSKAEKTAVPGESLAGYPFAPMHYADAYRIGLPDCGPVDLKELACRLFGRRESFPVYVGALLYLRDILVKPLKLKTAKDFQPIEPSGNQLPLFEILRQSEQEIILGENDRHLDFRVSLLKTRERGRDFLTVSTFVRMHNLIGRTYFAIIKPFHRLVVMTTMNKGLN